MSGRVGFRGNFWPDPKEETLLRAALADDADAARAWHSIRSRLDIDRVPHDVLRILPLVHARFADEDHPIAPRLRGLYRRTWFANQMLLDALRDVLQRLHAAGIQTMVLKGVPLALGPYGDLGLRPMGDVDVVVPPGDAARAIDLLIEAGWRTKRPIDSLPVDRMLRRQHGIAMEGPRGQRCDLHWEVSADLIDSATPAESSTTFWAGSVPLDCGGVETRALGPADQLLHVCVHGARAHSGARLQWVADSVAILRRERIDWDRLPAQARRFRTFLQIREALLYLRRVLDVPVPDAALSRLHVRPTPRDRFAAWALGRETRTLGPFLPRVGRYARLTRGWGMGQTIVGFPRYLQDAWNLDGILDVPAYGLRRLMGRRPQTGEPGGGR